jgi:hypothetical protein
MNLASSSLVLALQVVSAAFLSGCLAIDEGIEEEGIEDIGAAEERLLTPNSLTINALTANALTANALTANALTANALTANALTANSLVMNALSDAPTREFFSYVASCALPAGESIDLTINGVSYVFQGQIGVFPQWGMTGGKCEAGCQNWVSGCVLARVNYLGVRVPISIRATKAPLLALAPSEGADYSHREAAYYGNVFSHPQTRYACLSPGETSNPRVCGPSLDDCVMDVVGSCDLFCGAPHVSGAFTNCRDKPRDPATGLWPVGSQSYPGSITVYLKP